jgi:hypothetical protein
VKRKRPVEDRPASRDLFGVPEGSILLGQHDHVAVAEAGLAAGVVQQHEGEQRMGLGLVGHEFRKGLRQSQCFGGEIVAACPALVEDQVDNGKHRRQTIGEQVIRRDTEGNASVLDLALGSDQTLGHGRLRDQEGAGDLWRGQTAERAQSQGHLGVESERRMAASEHKLESLICKGCVVHGVFGSGRCLEEAKLFGVSALATDAVDRPPPARCDEPRAWAAWRALAWPSLGGRGECLLRGFLGEVEIAEEADERSEDAAPFVTEDPLENA